MGVLLLAPASAGAAPAPPSTHPAPTEASPAPEADPPTEATLTGVRNVAASEYHSCALLVNRQVRCWGYNGYGGLGNGETDDEWRAVTVRNATDTGPLVNVTQVVAGDYHTCALLTNRQVRCWGYNGDGELGTGDNDDRHLPTAVRNAGDTGPLTNVIEISAEISGTCALLTNRQVRCWGDDDYGQLGNGAPLEDTNLPEAVHGVNDVAVLSNIRSLGGGYDNNCAVTMGRQGRCWGYAGSDGALGNGVSDDTPYPVRVKNRSTGQPLTGIVQIANGGYTGCAVINTGQLRCWGDNDDGELGNNDAPNDRYSAVLVRRNATQPLNGVTGVQVTYGSVCASLNTGEVRCWGEDDYGQNGDGTIGVPEFRQIPNFVRNSTGSGRLGNVRQISGKGYSFCVTQNNGQVRCWGYGEYGVLGNNQENDRPLPVLVQV
jgi:alpha-tubulin suppressor-like RCC1 family protein